MENPVLYTIEGPAAIITLNRPERRNAINQALLTGLYNAMEDAGQNDQVRAIILTGNGKSFCSGLDLDIVTKENLFDPRGDGSDLPDVFMSVEKPIIGAINGHAITGGFEMALNCDFLVAGENALFKDSHAQVRIHPGWGITQLLQQAVGIRMAKQISFTCKFIDAKKALEIGLVNEVVPQDQLMARAKEIVMDIEQTDPEMIKLMKKLISNRTGKTHDQGYAEERTEFRDFVKKYL